MTNKFISSREEVTLFLQELIQILNDPAFDIDNDLDILLKKKTESPLDPFTTVNTLLELDFDKEDIRNQLISLNPSYYLETIIDSKDDSLPAFFAFVKVIKSRDIYIKVKIRNKVSKKVFCVSFHFARYPVARSLPYAE